MIENTTPYLGKMKIKFEKHPEYTRGKSGYLNKVHWDLGFTKLVSRFVPTQTKDGEAIDPKKIKLIEENTGGKIGTHAIKPNDPDMILHNSFLAPDGTYIGDIRQGWWYYKQGLKVYKDYPHGVAEIYEDGKHVGYHGHTHRGGSSFKIGDRLFDGEYEPKKEDYEPWQWTGWQQKFDEGYEKGDDFDKKHIYNDGIKCVIEFKYRGPKLIETMGEAAQAAINMSKYL